MDTRLIEVKRARPKDVHISPVTQEDVSDMARVFLLAFEADEYQPALFPSRVGLTTRELLAREGPLEERRFRRELLGKDVHVKASVQVVDDDGVERDTLVGWTRWVAPPGVRKRTIWEWLWSEVLYPLQQMLPRPLAAALPVPFPDAAMAIVTAQHADTFGPGGMAEGRTSWHLHFICVDPAWQGHGIGGALLKWGMENAKKTDSVVYLEASPVGRPFYIARGFRVASARPAEVNGIRITLPAMIWEPRIV